MNRSAVQMLCVPALSTLFLIAGCGDKKSEIDPATVKADELQVDFAANGPHRTIKKGIYSVKDCFRESALVFEFLTNMTARCYDGDKLVATVSAAKPYHGNYYNERILEQKKGSQIALQGPGNK